uniref:Uncharacterized protein n=1 Tax=Lepeophtheirus salmonis TaxID=72036 RepID=A0A0K2TM85_LEPSM
MRQTLGPFSLLYIYTIIQIDFSSTLSIIKIDLLTIFSMPQGIASLFVLATYMTNCIFAIKASIFYFPEWLRPLTPANPPS